jgi:hypothetical protein
VTLRLHVALYVVTPGGVGRLHSGGRSAGADVQGQAGSPVAGLPLHERPAWAPHTWQGVRMQASALLAREQSDTLRVRLVELVGGVLIACCDLGNGTPSVRAGGPATARSLPVTGR